jgi:hypothetical protein
MSGIGSVAPRMDLPATIIDEPVNAGSPIASGDGGRQPSDPGAPPIVSAERSLSSVLGFVMPLPPPTMNKPSLDGLQGKLDSNKPVDFAALMVMFEEEQQKVAKEQLKSKVAELENNKTAIKTSVNEDLKKIEEQTAKLQKQNKWGLFGKIFGGIAVALAVVAAVATGGALAIGVALVGALIFTMEQTGATQKMFDAMGLSEKAQKWIMIGVTVALTIASLGSAGMAVAAAKAGAATTAGSKLANLLPKVGSAAQVTGGISQVGVGTTQAGSAVNAYAIAELESDRKAIEAKNLQLKKQQDDMMQELQALLQKMEDDVQAVVQIVGAQHESIQQQMRNLKT